MEHVVAGDIPPAPPPLVDVPAARRRTAAEEARTLVAENGLCALATLADDRTPWASLATYGPMACGSAALYVSTLAEHGRNLERDARGSLVVAEDPRGADPLDSARVTLAGTFVRPDGAWAEEARQAHLAAHPGAVAYGGFGDFSFWVLRVERVRWVGGYGRMGSVDAASYRTAEPDPTAPAAAQAVAHLNDDHADALLAMAHGLAGHPDAVAARCARIDRYGLDLRVDTPRGTATARVGFAAPVGRADGLRAATVELARRSRRAVAT